MNFLNISNKCWQTSILLERETQVSIYSFNLINRNWFNS